jgi:two-component system, chemotaxis family, chemotaxis protein CheY
MRSLIVEDDRISCQVMEKMVSRYGNSDVAVNGQQALELFKQALGSDSPYDLVLMDIMIPEVDGLQSVLSMRQIETSLKLPSSRRVKVIMTTALDDPRTIMKALYESDANSYLVKPVRMQALEAELRSLKLVP